MTTELGQALDHNEVGEALKRAQEYVLGRQNPAGWWKGELRTNVTMDAEDLLLRQFLGILRTDELEQAARWIRSQQRTNGTWANSLRAVRPICPRRSRPMSRFAWPAMPLTMAISFRPGSGSASTAAWNPRESSPGSGSRCSVSGRGMSCRPCRPRSCCCRGGAAAQPLRLGLLGPPVRRPDHRGRVVAPGTPAAVHGGRAAYRGIAGRASPSANAQRGPRFQLLDRVLYRYEHSRVKPGRSAVLCTAPPSGSIARQEADGGWGGIQPPWVYSILALHLLGYPLDHPVLAGRHPQGLEGFLVPRADARWRRAAPRGVPITRLGHVLGRYRPC